MTKKKSGQSRFTKLPAWTDDVCQGLAFWLGYQRSYQQAALISEKAIVQEFLRMMIAKLDRSEELHAEVMYRLIAGATPTTSRNRIDALVTDKPKDKKIPIHEIAKYAIEVKRGSATKRDLLNDAIRLMNLKLVNPRLRAFLIVVAEHQNLKSMGLLLSQTTRGSKTAEIRANPKAITIEGYGQMRVRRICKATSSIASTKFHTAVLIEVKSSGC